MSNVFRFKWKCGVSSDTKVELQGESMVFYLETNGMGLEK